MRIDFRSMEVTPVALELDGYRLVTLDSGERHANAGGDDTADGYNQRRAECVRAAELLGVESLREATLDRVQELPEPLRARARHVVTENARVQDTVAALSNGDLERVGELLNASHASLRDCFAISTPTVEKTVHRLHGRRRHRGADRGRRVRRARAGTDAARYPAAGRRAGG